MRNLFGRNLTCLMAAALVMACDRPQTPSEPVLPQRWASAAENHLARTIDDFWAQQARDEIPGFAGYYLDSVGVVVVQIASNADEARVIPAVRAALGHRTHGFRWESKRIRINRVSHDFVELVEYRNKVLDLLNEPGVYMLDIDEKANDVFLGVQDEATRTKVKARVKALGVPEPAIRVERIAKPEMMTSLLDYYRPVVGGLAITVSDARCSLGFSVNHWQYGYGFVTASHCSGPVATIEQNMGRVDGYSAYQPFAGDDLFRVATETIDPPFIVSQWCPTGRRCRYSDAAFFLYRPEYVRGDKLNIGNFAYGYASTMGGSPELDWMEWHEQYDRSKGALFDWGNAGVGEYVTHIGRTSGSRSGSVQSTCGHYNVFLPNGGATHLTVLCQTRVSGTADGGDSGGPTIFRGLGWDTLLGITWMRGDGYWVYSPASMVDSDMGYVLSMRY